MYVETLPNRLGGSPVRTLILCLGLIAVMTLSACDSTGSAQPGDSDSARTSGATAPGDNATGDSAKGDDAKAEAGPDGAIPKSCDITKLQVRLVVRDWQRVIGSIDREDHTDYTGAFHKRMTRLSGRAAHCPGAKDLERFQKVSARIDRSVDKDGTAPLAAYEKAEKAGDTWLDELGFASLRLAV